MKIAATFIATTTALVLPSLAMANTTSENISVCQTEIREQLSQDAKTLEVDFRKVKGTSRLQTLSFRLEMDGERDNVKCKVRRDDSVEIDWGKDIKPTQARIVENTKTEKSVSGGE